MTRKLAEKIEGAVSRGAVSGGQAYALPPRPRVDSLASRSFGLCPSASQNSSRAFPTRSNQRRIVTRRWFELLLVLSLCASGCQHTAPAGPSNGDMVGSLNALRDDINARYGFRNGVPRINLGPCGRFARDLRKRWNTRFREPTTIAFIMSNSDPSNCFHVLVRLPDGRYYDGGNGVMTRTSLTARYQGGHIEE